MFSLNGEFLFVLPHSTCPMERIRQLIVTFFNLFQQLAVAFKQHLAICIHQLLILCYSKSLVFFPVYQITCPLTVFIILFYFKSLVLFPVYQITCSLSCLSNHLSTHCLLYPVIPIHLSSFMFIKPLALFPVYQITCPLIFFFILFYFKSLVLFPVYQITCSLSCLSNHLSTHCLLYPLLFQITCPLTCLSNHLSTHCLHYPLLFEITCPLSCLSNHLLSFLFIKSLVLSSLSSVIPNHLFSYPCLSSHLSCLSNHYQITCPSCLPYPPTYPLSIQIIYLLSPVKYFTCFLSCSYRTS